MQHVESLYQQIILDHFKHPHHRGLRAAAPGQPTAEVHHVNTTCGDEVTLRVALAADGGGSPVVVDVSYEGQGCSISQASTSVMTDLVIGRPLAEGLARQARFLALMQSQGAQDWDDEAEDLLEDAVAFSGVSKYPARVKCALLGWMAFKDAAAQAVAAAGTDGSGR